MNANETAVETNATCAPSQEDAALSAALLAHFAAKGGSKVCIHIESCVRDMLATLDEDDAYEGIQNAYYETYLARRVQR